ncbi:MAG: hypothetical protein NTV70_00855 [Acidobacteria bacterium]|nr:hypothetical protein [Acidobacteriota bacterium]
MLPLLVDHHIHRAPALRWAEGLMKGEVALCRAVQLSLVRLMCNRAIMGEFVIPASAAWTKVMELLDDERFDFSLEPATVDTVLPQLLRYATPTGKLVSDAYLAAFSIAGNMRLATFDTGFRQFRGIDLHLLKP